MDIYSKSVRFGNFYWANILKIGDGLEYITNLKKIFIVSRDFNSENYIYYKPLFYFKS